MYYFLGSKKCKQSKICLFDQALKLSFDLSYNFVIVPEAQEAASLF
jgi:hypothetical protein